MSKKHKTYTTEFKAEAIKLIEANQGNVSETARQQHFNANPFKLEYQSKGWNFSRYKTVFTDLNALLEENKNSNNSSK